MTIQRTARLAATLVLALSGTTASWAQGGASLNLLCSVQDEWCTLIGTTYSRVSGVKVNVLKRSSGEALAQLIAEKSNPKTDVWFGGTGDPHMQAAELGLTMEYKSPTLPKLHSWAQDQARQSGWRTVGVTLGPLGFAVNKEMLAKRKLAAPKCWKDLAQPALRGEVQVANPNSSGTAYTMIATLVQMMGEDKAFEYLKTLHKNVSQYTRSGTGPLKAVARGEAMVSVSFLQDVPGEQIQGFPVEAVVPCEGTGAEIGSMSIIKGARNADSARKFYDWALSPGAQQFGQAAKQFHLPSNKETPLDPRMPALSKTSFIEYDYAKYGSTAERKRLIDRWEREVNSAPH